MSGRKIYFASDLHLGTPNHEQSLRRERHFVRWLDLISEDAGELYLLGDVFDFWFEYRKAVPRGFVRILGKLAELCDKGVNVYFFAGNHDLWLTDYFPKEIGMQIHTEPCVKEFFGQKYFLGHGDGLGPGEHSFKFLRGVFRIRFLQWAFAKVHPDTGIRIAEYFSRRSRAANAHLDQTDYGEKEFQLIFSREYSRDNPDVSYFVFGHRHLPVKREFSPGKFYVNLGDWIGHCSYAVADEEGLHICRLPHGDDSTPVVLLP